MVAQRSSLCSGMVGTPPTTGHFVAAAFRRAAFVGSGCKADLKVAATNAARGAGRMPTTKMAAIRNAPGPRLRRAPGATGAGGGGRWI
jgi:hypothetical protein